SYGKGQGFCDSINMRRRPIFGQVHQLTIDPTLGQNASGTWNRFLLENPPERPWVDNQEEYELYKTLHLQLKEEHSKGNIEAEYDSGELSEGSGATGEYAAAPTA